jgi:hypothetical protein
MEMEGARRSGLANFRQFFVSWHFICFLVFFWYAADKAHLVLSDISH